MADWFLRPKPRCIFQIPAQPKAGGLGGYWPARRSGARAVLLLLYREHLVSTGPTQESGAPRQWGPRLLEGAGPSTDPPLVTES